MKKFFITIFTTFVYQSAIAQNVGIGIATPTSKLHVVGNVLVDAGDITINDLYGSLYFRANVGSSKASVALSGSDNDFKVGTLALNSTGKFQLQTQGVPKLTIDPDGHVGIGTIAPNVNYKLDVRGSIRNEGDIYIEDGYLRFANTVDAKNWTIQYSNATSRLVFLQQGVERLTLENGGNMGIGVTNPLEKLEVDGNIFSNSSMIIDNASGILQLKNSNVDKAFVQLSGNNLRIGTNSGNTTGKFVLRLNGDESFQVDADGNVGIGASTASARLHIGSGQDAGLPNTTNGYIMLGNYTGSNLIIDNNEIIARGSNGAVGNMVLQNDGGTVRIGNVAVPSGYKFAINGKMICEELKVKLASSGWPDYVFANNYKLKALDEVEKFINQNKHLPNIPSASEVEKNGIEVGDMQKRMMEKIEELTLYIIELKKEVNSLKVIANKL